MKKTILSTLAALACCMYAHAQISYGGTPPSFKYLNKLKAVEQPCFVETSHIDVKELARQDSISERNGSALRFATIIPVDVDINRTGGWETLPEGTQIWRQTILAPNAQGIILGYKDFYIPEGGQLFVYNKDHSYLLGAYTNETNPGGGKFSNEVISGDEITLEYVASASSDKNPRLIVEDIGYVYRSVFTYAANDEPSDPGTRLGRAPYCTVNINCTEGEGWRKQQRGIVRIAARFRYNWALCSASLVNNTRNDGSPYVLTATHCFYEELIGSMRDAADFNTAHFYFNFEHPYCGNLNIVPSGLKTLIGSQLLTYTLLHGGSDGLLLKLNNNVPVEWNPYYNGWNASSDLTSTGVSIHHPEGDVKKISTYKVAPKPVTWNGSNITGTVLTGAPNAHLDVVWAPTLNSHSVTAGGSSGSPIFNSNGLIIGTLSGGSSLCSSPYKPDQYGRMSYHFDQDQDRDRRMQRYLDPLNTGVTSLAGYDPTGGVGIEEVRREIVKMVIFPNPAQNEININTRNIINRIRLTDINGRIVYESKGEGSSTAIVTVTNLPNGVYTVSVETEDGILSDKFIKN